MQSLVISEFTAFVHAAQKAVGAINIAVTFAALARRETL
jgi:hypothetical protein